MADREHAQQRITACWNMASGSYDATPGHGILREEERAAWLEVLRELLPPPPADVLDVGTGTGFLAMRAWELGHRVRGVDLSEGMLAVAREAARTINNGPEFAMGDAMAPGFPAASFDVVMNRHLLWTLTEPERAIRNWRELLRHDGRLVIIDGIWGDDHDDEDKDDEEDDGHGDDYYTDEVMAKLPVTRMTGVDEVIRLLASTGFGAVRQIDLSRIDDAEGHLKSVQGRYGLVAGR